MTKGLPWWLTGEESTCQCRRYWFNPWPRKIPHGAEQLSPRATIAEACAPYSLCSATWGGARGACSPARTGPAEGRLHSRPVRLPAAQPARGGGGRTPGGSGDRGAGAGRGWAGPPSRLLEPGWRPRDQARGRGEAGAGTPACNLAPSSEWSGPLQQPRPGSRRLRAHWYVINK